MWQLRAARERSSHASLALLQGGPGHLAQEVAIMKSLREREVEQALADLGPAPAQA